MILKTNKGIEFIIDSEDYDVIKNHTWYRSKIGYIVSDIFINKNKNNQIRLHRLIMNADNKMLIDHIDGNKLDNRKCNLRLATKQENARNSKIPKSNTSQYKNVSFRKDRNKWRSYINISGKQISLGHFETKEEAAIAYNNAAIFHFKEFARLNVIKNEKR